MKKVIRLTESELVKVIRQIIKEDVKPKPKIVKVEGYDVTINYDDTGTITIKNNKIKLSHSLGDIRVANIKKTNNGYEIEGYSGNKQEVPTSDIKKILDFANSEKVKEEIGSFLNKLTMKKVS